MKKGIIVAITVVICAVLAATYTFAAPTKDQEPSEEDCEYEDNGENDAEVIE